jgi:hypothetical protein
MIKKKFQGKINDLLKILLHKFIIYKAPVILLLLILY